MKTKKILTQFRLIESKDKEGKEWDIVVIKSGLSKNNTFYPSEVLKKAVPLFENAKVCAYEFKGKLFNHLPDSVSKALPQGAVKNIVGWLKNPRFAKYEGDKEGILAKLHIAENAKWLRDLLKDTWQNGIKDFLGFSIDGSGEKKQRYEDGKLVDGVEDIKYIEELTAVSNPSAGGELMRLLASIEGDNEMLKKLLEMLKGKHADLIEGIDPESVTDEQFVSLMETVISDDRVADMLKEGFVADAIEKLLGMVKDEKALAVLKDLSARLKKEGYPVPTKESDEDVKKKEEEEDKKKADDEAAKKKADDEEAAKKAGEKKDDVKEELRKMREELDLERSATTLSGMLKDSDLPDPVKDKVDKQFAGKIFKKEELQEAIKAEKDVLAKLSESGQVKGLGQHGGTEVIADEADKLQVAVDKMLDPEMKDDGLKESLRGIDGFTSIKEAYRTFYPEDPNITGQIDISRRFKRLTENIITTDFTYALSVSMTKRAAKEFVIEPFIFAPIVEERPLKDFKQQEIIKWGGFSTLPTVAERGDYTDLYEPSDERAVYTPGKKGGIVYITRETIKNDDMRYIQKIPKKVTDAAKRTLQRIIAGLIIDNGTYGPTNTAVFTVAQGNYSTDSLNYDNLQLRKNAMKKQRERGTAQLAGTVTGAGNDYINDSSESAVILDDVFNGEYVRIVYGPGAGQTRLITDTETSGSKITVSPDWTTNPTTASKYEISVASNDDEKIGLKAKHILYGDSLESQVDALLTSDKNPEKAEFQRNIHKGSLNPIYIPHLETSTNQYYWFLAADKAQTELIEIGYVDNQRTPLLLVQDQANLGNVFEKDEIRYKIRWEFGYAVVENKGLDGNFATAV